MYRSLATIIIILIPNLVFSQNDTSGLIPVFNVYNLSEVNSKGLDFCPVVYEDKLVFVSEREIDYINYGERSIKSVPYLSIQYSEIKGNVETPKLGDSLQYSEPRVFSNRISQLNFNGPVCFNKEGNYAVFTKLVFFKKENEKIYRPQLFSAKKENDKWKEIKMLNINKEEFSFGHSTLSADGQYLYFSSDMEGGYGGKDIYVSGKEGELWGEPVNLGPEINTAGNEMFPFIYKDSLLYYSSDGHEGSGGLDLFFAGKIDGNWIFVSNLGATINSGFDDFGIFLNDDGNSGFFSSNRPGGMGGDDIYGFTVKWILPEKEKTMAGRFVYKTLPHKNAQGLKVFLINDEGKIVYTTTSDEKGDFVFENLPYGKNFIVKIDEQDNDIVLLILDEDKNVIDELTNDISGEFVYKKLSYKQFGGLAFLYTSDTQLDSAEITKSLTGQFRYSKLPGEYPKGMKVFLVNEEGEILYTAVADAKGMFIFENLPFDQNYIIKTEEYDPEIKLLIIKDDDVVAELASNEQGKFLYVKLSYDVIENLALLDAKDASVFIDEYDINFRRSIGTPPDVNKENAGVISEDNKAVFIFKKLQPDNTGNPELMTEANPGLCPGTFDLELEEESDCIDMAIEDLMKETERKVERPARPDADVGLIYFDVNSSYLTQEAKAALDKIFLDFSNQPQLKLEVNAYTDTRSDENYNLWISERRANRIISYLAQKGVDAGRMTGKGYGETNLAVVCNDCTEEEHRLNRRAVLRIYQGK